MSQIKVEAFKCDRSKCGHVWLAARKPKACAKCKSRNWDTMVVVAEAATTISKIDTINHVIEYSVESAKLARIHADKWNHET